MKARRTGILFLLALATAGVGPQQVLPQTSGIRLEGKVLRLGTSDPIPNAEIFLVGMNPNLPNTVTPDTAINAARLLNAATTAATESAKRLMESTAFSFVEGLGVPPELLRPTSTAMVMSDSMGNFRFTDLAGGRYSLSVSKEGFFAPSVGGYSGSKIYKNVRLDSTKTTVTLDAFMVQGGVISGHVQDSSGPAVAARVQASQRSYPGGKFTLTLRTSESTDDRGDFRFADLLPGEYLLSVTTDTNELPTRDRAPGVAATAERGAATLTYYPNVADPWAAVPVIVQDGSVTSGINIEVQNRKTSTFKISGVVLNNSPVFQGNPQAVIDRSVGTFYLVPLLADVMDNSPLAFENAIPVGSRPNGEFEIQNVPTGRYELYPFYRSFISTQPMRTRNFTSRTEVEVRDKDVTNLSIAVKPGATLNVEVVAASTSNSFGSAALSLGLRVLDLMPANFVTFPRQFDSAGKLTLQNIPEARYGLSLSGLPDSAYVSDVRQDGKSIFDDGFLLQQSSNPIQILVSQDGGTVSGRIRNPRGPTSDITVVLVPSLARRRNAALFKTATTDDDGAFIIRGVAPGTYMLVPLESRPAGEPWLNTEFMAKHEGRGRVVQITAGSTAQLNFN